VTLRAGNIDENRCRFAVTNEGCKAPGSERSLHGPGRRAMIDGNIAVTASADARFPTDQCEQRIARENRAGEKMRCGQREYAEGGPLVTGLPGGARHGRRGTIPAVC
jgi:hypothetical protein